MSVRRLSASDDYLHEAGPQPSWNESRYIDFYDPRSGVGGWLRLGMRPNEEHAEVSVCAYLPQGRCAFFYTRAAIDGNRLAAGGQEWTIGDPYRFATAGYHGPVYLFDDPWVLSNPTRAFAGAAQLPAAIDLRVTTKGLVAVMGSDQDDIDRIFLPGQADWHYQQLCWVEGTMRIGGETFVVSGRGGKDHSWGPRDWLAKIYLRWLIASSEDDELGFMLVRAVGPTKSTRSGHVWAQGAFHLVDDFEMTNRYAAHPPYELLRTEVTIRAGVRRWTAIGLPEQWLPLRHRSIDGHGEPAVLRIVKSPTKWVFGDGREGAGMCEIHDRIGTDGVPAGIGD